MYNWKLLMIPAFSFIASIISSVFGGWNELMLLLLIAVILDYIFGILVAYIKGTISSQVGWKGITKKVFIFALVAVAHIADVVLGDKNIIRDATILFYLCNECISILENATKAGVPIPKALMNALQIINQKQKENTVNEKDKGQNQDDKQ